MSSFRERFVEFVSSDKWAGIKNFLGVLSILVGIMLAAAYALVPERFTTPLDFLKRTQNSEALIDEDEDLEIGELSIGRASANRCRSQLYDAIEDNKHNVAESALTCAETGYKEAIEQGDAFGHFGLHELYQDPRLTTLFSHLGDRSELILLAEEQWCKFSSSEEAVQQEMNELFDEIICP